MEIINNLSVLKISRCGELIDKKLELQHEKPRPHLGASQVGHYCERKIWLDFRWAIQEQFKGRIKRLFRRGQNEEETVFKDLETIGLNPTLSQSRISINHHFNGSIDGMVENVPEAPKTLHLLEIKTHNDKSFKDLNAKGVQLSKPQHYSQMQIYMHCLKLKRALYCAINKNDDTYYFERIDYDKEHAQEMIEKGIRIVNSENIPPPLHYDKTWYQCKMCAAWGFCHNNEPIKHKNCRTCDNCIVIENGFACTKWQAEIPLDAQYQGCDFWKEFIRA